MHRVAVMDGGGAAEARRRAQRRHLWIDLELHLAPLLPCNPLLLDSAGSLVPRRVLALRCRQGFFTRTVSAGAAGSDIPTSSSEKLTGGDQRSRRKSVAGVDQDELLDPILLADPDSLFFELKGVRIHHKICRHEEKQEDGLLLTSVIGGSTPMILFHGFGASVFSWERVMQPLATIAGAPTLAFDRPGFGLTSRPGNGSSRGELNPYSAAFSVLSTFAFMDMLGSQKAVLMGHSAGCISAIDAYFEAPERVASLILVAPAIDMVERVRQGKQMENGWLALMSRTMWEAISTLYWKAWAAGLRSGFSRMLLREIIDKYGILAVRYAWHDARQFTNDVVQGYTKPMKSKDWEAALLEHTIALLADSASLTKPSFSERLLEVSCPVLIITGDTDRIIPSWNAERLSRAIPGSTIRVIKECGHMPHEEKPEEFLFIVRRFFAENLGFHKDGLLHKAIA